MDAKLLEYVGNPILCRLLFEIDSRGQATTKELAQAYSDIPQTSLYRYLSRMLHDGILEVIEERRIRGMVEKVYALKVSLEIDEKDLLHADAAEKYYKLFSQFSVGLLREFQEYTEKENIDIANDGSGFWLTPLYLSDQELDELAADMQTLLNERSTYLPDDGRKLRNVAVVITPPKDTKANSPDCAL